MPAIEALRESSFRIKLWSDRGKNDRVPELVVSTCGHCGAVFFPAMQVCLKCADDQAMRMSTLKGRGHLYSFTEIERAAPGFSSPYYLGFVDLDGGPRAIFQLGDCTRKDLKIGMEMEAYIGLIRIEQDGMRVMGPMFRPVRN